ncbi:phasin family protein [Methylocaldum sp.]|uniref:phasin family protein n=1 Tax=Methylocaldum sp. TaxID=1969727 RepID=UPI002D4707A0|nr:phasin family protein [Methylocaldum sp.]HYE37772.1 phasin family protein [Methylocaldum sp.]
MNTRQICDQWFEMNRAAMDPFMRWNEIALQAAERMAGNRQMYEQWFEMNRAAIDPLMRWNEIALQAAERVAKCNLAMAQDYLELGTRQAELSCEARDPEKWKDEEKKFVSEFGRKIVDHAGDYLTVARETQDAMNEWANQTARETAERAARAADTTARAAAESTARAAGAAKAGAQQPHREPQKEPQKG